MAYPQFRIQIRKAFFGLFGLKRVEYQWRISRDQWRTVDAYFTRDPARAPKVIRPWIQTFLVNQGVPINGISVTSDHIDSPSLVEVTV